MADSVSMAASKIRILIINPNTSQSMTDALIPVVESLNYHGVTYSFFTCPEPEGIGSINSPEDAEESAKACIDHLVPLLADHDAFLIACYSQHPLVPQLQNEIDRLQGEKDGEKSKPKYVTGIFEASVTTSLTLVGSTSNTGFGIVSTGKIWEAALQHAVDEFWGINAKSISRFLGCETTGLNASELHELPPKIVREKMKEATARLLDKGQQRNTHVRAICLGCAGMVGLEESVREACIEKLGKDAGSQIAIVDGVKAGVGALVSLSKCGF